MTRLKLLRDPGFIYDLNFIFCLKFNKKEYISQLPSDKTKTGKIKNFDEVEKHFGDISDELYVFYHSIENGRTFVPKYYFEPYQDRFATDYNFDFMMKELSDREKLIRNLIKFYFYNLSEEEIEKCAASLKEISSRIKSSEYSDEEKRRLYEFFIDPTPCINRLYYELIEKEIKLENYYKEHYQKVIDLYNNTTFENLCKQFKDIRGLYFLKENNEEAYISYCLLNISLVCLSYIDTGALTLLGIKYIEEIASIVEDQLNDGLCNFGISIGDESREKIFKFIFDRSEITAKDLEREFNFSGSTSYHHITLMTRIGLLKTRNEGKTVLYSVNKSYLKKITNYFIKILN